VVKNSSVLNSWDLLKDRATGNHAIDREAYGMFPHLFCHLAIAYPVPAELFLTIVFLWDRTVGADVTMPDGRCALSQIPVRERNKRRWLAALIAVGFWDCREKSGMGDKMGSLYEYRNPTAEEWETFFKVASLTRYMQDGARGDEIEPEIFGRVFARALGKVTDPPDEQADGPTIKRILRKMAAVRKAKQKKKAG